jgi:hypothetical protein
MRKPLRLSIVASVVAVAALAFASAATAVNPHFQDNRTTGTLNSDGTLTVSFKEVGLGDNQLIDYRVDANANITYVCVNRGGANPSASNKTTVSGPVSQDESIASDKNGNVTGRITLRPPAVPEDFSCPKGQRLDIAQVTYTDVTLTDLTTPVGPVTVGSGTFASGCLLPNVRGACD